MADPEPGDILKTHFVEKVSNFLKLWMCLKIYFQDFKNISLAALLNF